MRKPVDFVEFAEAARTIGRFWLSLNEPPTRGGAAVTASLRILLVEDSPTDARLMLRELQRAGLDVELARVEDAAGLAAALDRGGWDAVLCDWTLPAFDPLQALALLRDKKLDLPFIIVSGTVGEELAVEAMRAGAHDYVLKDRLARLAPALEREVREARDRAARRRADAALRESEARYRRIIETNNQGVWMIDAEGRTTFMNARMAAMLGIDLAEAVGLSPTEFLDEEGREELTRSVAGHQVGRPSQVEVRYLRRDGSSFWALLETSPLLDAAGRHEGALAMVMDVSERRRAEEALRASEARFRRLWESGIILITISDTDGNILDINEAGADMLGYSRDELLAGAVRWPDLTPPEWRQAEGVALAQLAASGVATPWEKELFRKDGSRLPILAAAALIDGKVGIAIAVDLSAAKRSERALDERMKLAELTHDVGIALTGRSPLRETLQRCAEAMVEHLGAAFARIWTLDAGQQVLELQASAGLYTHLDGPHGRVPVGTLKIGRIAADRRPHFTNDVQHDPRISSPEWARREGMVAFAGHPLLVGGELVGVMAMFARRALSEVTVRGLASIADAVAVGIQRGTAERARAELEDQLRQSQKMEAVGPAGRRRGPRLQQPADRHPELRRDL